MQISPLILSFSVVREVHFATDLSGIFQWGKGSSGPAKVRANEELLQQERFYFKAYRLTFSKSYPFAHCCFCCYICVLCTDAIFILLFLSTTLFLKFLVPWHLRRSGFYLPILSEERKMVYEGNKMIPRMKSHTPWVCDYVFSAYSVTQYAMYGYSSVINQASCRK